MGWDDEIGPSFGDEVPWEEPDILSKEQNARVRPQDLVEMTFL